MMCSGVDICFNWMRIVAVEVLGHDRCFSI